ncbi:acyltransferase [Marinobacter sp. BGYM27]|uniref:acyltransferase family protein n=1 Tax=Marinobacter sp. BGYM27 TaxID=2975597 RepID=UPI0021A6E3F9|nr:acyltransferase [Marinobacter sp. BGYM27]MDG5499003.1 acyltransferase [Marinobacter sp. BGYM27]
MRPSNAKVDRALPSLDTLLERSKLPGFDGFRMIAVMSVVLYHAGVGTIFSARHGVAGFFVLSGFLITWLLLKEFDRSGRVSLKDFYKRRTLRIFPAYYAFLLVSISWDLYRGNTSVEPMILPSVFYWVNYHNALAGHSSTSLTHLWSLAVEEQFYLIWPLIFVLAMKSGRKVAIAFLCVAVIGVMFWRSYAFSVLDWGTSYVYNAFDTRFDNLAVGCLLAFALANLQVRRILEALSSKAWMPLVTISLLFLSLRAFDDNYRYGPAFSIDAILLGILLIQFLRLSEGWAWGWLNHPVSVYLGMISYPIYLWHVWGIQAGHKLGFLPESLEIVAGIGASILLAAMSYHLIEKPFLRLKGKRLLSSHKPSAKEGAL